MIDKILGAIIILCQLTTAFIVAFVLYLFFALYDAEYGFIEIIGLVVFQSILGFFVSLFSIVCCMVLGLPIRALKKLNAWWISHFYITILAVFVGFVLLILSLCFKETVMVEIDGDREVEKLIPNVALLISGWFMVIFMILHMYPPKIVKEKARQLLSFIFEKCRRLLQ